MLEFHGHGAEIFPVAAPYRDRLRLLFFVAYHKHIRGLLYLCIADLGLHAGVALINENAHTSPS